MLGEKFPLTVADYRALAELAASSSFILLLDVLQADIDDLANTLATADTNEAEQRALIQWRALRSELGVLQSMPIWATEQMEALAESGDMDAQTFMGQDMTPTEEGSVYDQFTDKPTRPAPNFGYFPAQIPLDDQ